MLDDDDDDDDAKNAISRPSLPAAIETHRVYRLLYRPRLYTAIQTAHNRYTFHWGYIGFQWWENRTHHKKDFSDSARLAKKSLQIGNIFTNPNFCWFLLFKAKWQAPSPDIEATTQQKVQNKKGGDKKYQLSMAGTENKSLLEIWQHKKLHSI